MKLVLKITKQSRFWKEFLVIFMDLLSTDALKGRKESDKMTNDNCKGDLTDEQSLQQD